MTICNTPQLQNVPFLLDIILWFCAPRSGAKCQLPSYEIWIYFHQNNKMTKQKQNDGGGKTKAKAWLSVVPPLQKNEKHKTI